MAELRAALGDFLDGGRPDGIFFMQVGGPGSVPALADLDRPELHLDLLPGPPTDEQRAALLKLGYQPEGEHWRHRAGWRLVLPDHTAGWRAEQKALSRLLRNDADAARAYREVFEARGRADADEALAGSAREYHARTVGFGPAHFVAQTLAPLAGPWMFAAGTALDLHLGKVTRPHDDLDIAFPREGQMALREVLHAAGWRLDLASGNGYAPWTAPLQPPQHQVHARHPDLPDVLMADFLLTDLSGDQWHYRRDPRITLPLAQARRISPEGLPYLAPQAALLFKSATSGGQPRAKDQRDFLCVVASLDTDARQWLAEAIGQSNPAHPWLVPLQAP